MNCQLCDYSVCGDEMANGVDHFHVSTFCCLSCVHISSSFFFFFFFIFVYDFFIFLLVNHAFNFIGDALYMIMLKKKS